MLIMMVNIINYKKKAKLLIKFNLYKRERLLLQKLKIECIYKNDI